MKRPFILEASGAANGIQYKLYSFADGPDMANINPLSNAAVALAGSP
jgi:hypothetical protein